LNGRLNGIRNVLGEKSMGSIEGNCYAQRPGNSFHWLQTLKEIVIRTAHDFRQSNNRWNAGITLSRLELLNIAQANVGPFRELFLGQSTTHP
jgi:hypothetical protein